MKAKQINANNEASDLESFEWYADFEDLLPHFQDGLIEGESQRILVPGCGNSLLSEKLCTVMHQTKVSSLDFVAEIVQKMNERGVSGVTYSEGDLLQMSFADHSFDVVVGLSALEMALRHFGHDAALGRGPGAAGEVLLEMYSN